jgi:hypothetical protein
MQHFELRFSATPGYESEVELERIWRLRIRACSWNSVEGKFLEVRMLLSPS